MIAAHQTMLAPQGAPLPYDAEVAWIESSGTQYIDTGVQPGPNIRTVLDCSYDSSGTKSAIVCGTRSPKNTNGRYYVLGMDSSYRAKSTFGTTNYQSTESGARRTVDFNNSGNILWNGVVVAQIANTGTVSAGYPIYICSSNGWDTATQFAANARIYSCKIYSGNTLLRDFTPVRVGTAGYLYDRANPTGGPSGNGLYGSETATPLVAGPDKNGG